MDYLHFSKVVWDSLLIDTVPTFINNPRRNHVTKLEGELEKVDNSKRLLNNQKLIQINYIVNPTCILRVACFVLHFSD